MKLKQKYHFEELVNIAENLVIEELERQLEDAPANFIENEDSVLDIVALALNNLPPMYRANLLGRMYEPALDKTHREQIAVAVRTALEKVSQNPPKL